MGWVAYLDAPRVLPQVSCLVSSFYHCQLIFGTMRYLVSVFRATLSIKPLLFDIWLLSHLMVEVIVMPGSFTYASYVDQPRGDYR